MTVMVTKLGCAVRCAGLCGRMVSASETICEDCVRLEDEVEKAGEISAHDFLDYRPVAVYLTPKERVVVGLLMASVLASGCVSLWIAWYGMRWVIALLLRWSATG